MAHSVTVFFLCVLQQTRRGGKRGRVPGNREYPFSNPNVICLHWNKISVIALFVNINEWFLAAFEPGGFYSLSLSLLCVSGSNMILKKEKQRKEKKGKMKKKKTALSFPAFYQEEMWACSPEGQECTDGDRKWLIICVWRTWSKYIVKQIKLIMTWNQ